MELLLCGFGLFAHPRRRCHSRHTARTHTGKEADLILTGAEVQFIVVPEGKATITRLWADALYLADLLMWTLPNAVRAFP